MHYKTTKTLSHNSSLANLLSVNALPPPSVEQEVALIARVQQGDENAKTELLFRFGKLLLKRIARYAAFARTIGVDYNDLLMDSIGILFYCAKHFNGARSRFSTYLTVSLDREMRRKMYQYPLFGSVSSEHGHAKRIVSSLDETNSWIYTHQDYDADCIISDAEDAILVQQILDAAMNIDHPGIPILMAYSIGGQPMSQIIKDYMITPKKVSGLIEQAAILIRYQIGLPH